MSLYLKNIGPKSYQRCFWRRVLNALGPSSQPNMNVQKPIVGYEIMGAKPKTLI